MNTYGFSADERRRLGLARGVIYAAPAAAGLLTICAAVAADMAGPPVPDEQVAIFAFVGNTFLAGVASAYAVARLHPVERGKWWRAAASFLFALPVSLASLTFFGAIAGCFGLIA